MFELYPYPWQQKQWQHLLASKAQQKLPHALLLTGPKGLGKFDFAKNFAAFLLCNNPTNTACGECNSCQLLLTNNHPDLLIVEPEKADKPIKIDQVRELIFLLNQTPQQGVMQVAIINQADTLNIASQNALLKTLEEPMPKVLIMLVTAHQAALPATVISRCQKIGFNSPTKDVAADWLKTKGADPALLKLALSLTDNAPGAALILSEDTELKKREELLADFQLLSTGKLSPLKFAATCLDFELKFILETLQAIVIDLVKIKSGITDALLNQDKIQFLLGLAPKLALLELFKFYDKTLQIKQHLQNNINLNKQLVLESLWLTWESGVKNG